MLGQGKDGFSLALEQTGCHTLQIPTFFSGSLFVEICPDTTDNCGHVVVYLENAVDTKVEICEKG